MKLSPTKASARSIAASEVLGASGIRILESENGEIGWQRRARRDRRLAFAVQDQARGVEHGARDAPVLLAVDRIADQRKTQPGQRMDADLVGAPRDRREADHA